MPQLNTQTYAACLAELAVELRVLIGQLRRRMLDRADLGDLRPSQTAVLKRIDEYGPATVTALAREQGMRSQSMGANVSALEAAGLVSGAPDPTDGRQTLFSLTPECRRRIRTGRLAREDWLVGALGKALSAEEQDELARAVRLLRRLVES